MSFLKQLLGRYLGGHQGGGGHGNKHGGGGGGHGGKHGYGYNNQPPYNNTYDNPVVNNRPGIICASCNVTNLADAKFCQQCGKSLSTNCSGCGASLLADAKFCAQCGKARV